MKNRSLRCASALTVLSLLGWGAKHSSASSETGVGRPRLVEISANDAMKYSRATIEAKPGEQLTVVLTNAGAMPKAVMGHNWILLKAGSDPAAFAAAAVQAKDTDYVPPSLKGQILAQIPLLGPRKSDEVTFTVPATPGNYPYLCTFPAHFQVGMRGLLVVK